MREIAAAAQPFVREELDRAAALERFADHPFSLGLSTVADPADPGHTETGAATWDGLHATPPQPLRGLPACAAA